MPETITILPAKALELFLNTELPPADILDASMPIGNIPNMFDGKIVKNPELPCGCVEVRNTSKHIRKEIAIAEDLHAGFDDETIGCL